MSTATDEQVAVIRRGWMGTAVSVAPEVAGLTEFMEDRLVDLESRGELTENDLLAVVEAASQMVLASGNPDQARDTSRRMRRTVYEFLLALDASSTDEAGDPAHPRALPGSYGQGGFEPVPSAPEQGASATAANGAADEFQLAATTDPDTEPVWAPTAVGSDDDPEASSGWEAVGRRRSVSSHDEPGDGAGAQDAGLSPATVAPRAGFHLTDPIDLDEPVEPSGSAPGPEELSAAGPIPPSDSGGAPESVDLFESADYFEPGRAADPGQSGVAEPPERALTYATPGAPDGPGLVAGPTDPTADELPAEFDPLPDAATKANGDGRGLDLPAEPATQAAEAGTDFQELVTPPLPVRPPALQTPAAWTAKVSEAARLSEVREEPSLVPDLWADDLAEDSEDPSASEGVASSWRVRKPELAADGGRRGSSGDLPANSWQSPDDDVEPEPDLSAPRRDIDDLLRRKKYDQTGAILQQLAQEPGGRAVAELALDIGDRCRAMGKRMAATSCYLAASRADPVFEEPLGRLADVCIDDRDIDLAVSYLERIARLTRARGDVKGALRIYRKIHAIAPYRDDILDLLMRAQTTGRFDP